MIKTEEKLQESLPDVSDYTQGTEIIYSMKGVTDRIEVYCNKLTITPVGLLGFLNKGFKGTKDIPYASITAIQMRKAGAIVNGYIQFSILGGNESKGGILSAVSDENTFLFSKMENNFMAEKIKDYVYSKIHADKASQHAPSSLSNELQNLAKLRDQGILSEEEFSAAKRGLLK